MRADEYKHRVRQGVETLEKAKAEREKPCASSS